MLTLGSNANAATHVVAELAGGEQGLDGGPKAHDVEHGARGQALQGDHHALLYQHHNTQRSVQTAHTSLDTCSSFSHSSYKA